MRRLAPYALAGTVAGLGLGLGSNVSGAVLAFFGLAAGVGVALTVWAAGRRGGTTPAPQVALRTTAAGALLAAVCAVVFGAILVRDGENRSAAADRLPAEARAFGSGEATNAGDPVAREDRLVQLPLPDPAAHRLGSPRRAAAEFLDAWHDRAWDRMARWSAPLWRRNLPDPGASLRLRFGGERLRGALQERLERPAPDRASLSVELAVGQPADPLERRRVTLDLRRTNGRWSVEPISLAPARP